MNNSKLINILRTFSKSEMKEFEKFVSSLFFNKGRNYIPFLNQLKKFYPKFENEKMTPEYIYSKMYPGKKFNKQVIWNLTSSLLKMTEEFLMHISLKKNSFVRERQIAQELLDRRLSVYYNKKLNEMEAILDRMGLDDNYFRSKAQLEMGRMAFHYLEDTQHLLAAHIMKKGEYAVLNFMRDIAEVIGGLRVSSNMYNTNLDVNIPRVFIENLKAENVIEYAYENKFKYAPVLEMYYRSVMLAIDFENTEHFYKLKKLFELNYSSLLASEKYLWATELTNYCVQKINVGDESFRKTIVEIDKLKLKEGIVFPGKYIPKVLFTQIFANAIAANEFEWAEKFIEDYLPRLKPSYQKTMHQLFRAVLYYKLRDYDKVIDALSKAKFTDAIDKLYVKSIYIRTYYELGETEILLNQIDSTKHFLKKYPSLGSELRSNNERFLACLSKLMTLNEKYNDFETDKLIETIRADKSIPHRDWMLEKIGDLQKKH